MRSGILLLLVVLGVSGIGYLEISHQATREELRAENVRLQGRLDAVEQLAQSRAAALNAVSMTEWKRQEKSADLADMGARVIDVAADLARLESDRSVAQKRADTALHDLRNQVTALTTIEVDMASLDNRRSHLQRQVRLVEDQLKQAEVGAAERQKRSEALDRDIAGLAIRREALLSSLQATERSLAEAALAKVVSESAVPATASPAPAPKQVAQPQPIPAAVPIKIIEADIDSNRTRGLYQFGSLSADPEPAGGPKQLASLQQVETASSDEVETEEWVEDQYLLGLRLLAKAERSSGTRELIDAVLAFKVVLREFPKAEDPKRWAIARSDLGYALALLGKRRADADVLEEAAMASREALEEFDRDETPLLWAGAQQNLGISLSGLAAIGDDQRLRQASVDALEQAIATFKEAGAETDAQKAERRLREAATDRKADLN